MTDNVISINSKRKNDTWSELDKALEELEALIALRSKPE